MQKDMKVDALPQAIIFEPYRIRDRSGSVQSNQTADIDDPDADPEITSLEGIVSDSPNITLRKKLSS